MGRGPVGEKERRARVWEGVGKGQIKFGSVDQGVIRGGGGASTSMAGSEVKSRAMAVRCISWNEEDEENEEESSWDSRSVASPRRRSNEKRAAVKSPSSGFGGN